MHSLRIFLLIQSHLKYILHVLCHINNLQMGNIKKLMKLYKLMLFKYDDK